eukprot:Pgem_evm1s8009
MIRALQKACTVIAHRSAEEGHLRRTMSANDSHKYRIPNIAQWMCRETGINLNICLLKKLF